MEGDPQPCIMDSSIDVYARIGKYNTRGILPVPHSIARRMASEEGLFCGGADVVTNKAAL
jgi:hypothetical protein